MLKKIKSIFYLLIFVVFLGLIVSFYFSEKNIINTNKIRSIYSVKLNTAEGLPILKNDTSNIIEYSDDIELYKKRKKNFLGFN